MQWANVILGGLLGACVGSMLACAAWRIPRRLSMLPRSRCPACGTPIPAWYNVPVVSWVLLRGYARCCGAPLSVRYVLCETGAAVAGAIVAVTAGLPIVFAQVAAAIAVVAALNRQSLDGFSARMYSDIDMSDEREIEEIAEPGETVIATWYRHGCKVHGAYTRNMDGTAHLHVIVSADPGGETLHEWTDIYRGSSAGVWEAQDIETAVDEYLADRFEQAENAAQREFRADMHERFGHPDRAQMIREGR